MIFDLLVPPQGHRGRGLKTCAVACAIHASNSYTKLVEFRENQFFDPQPPRYPQVSPLGHDPGDGIKIPSDMFYIFHLLEDTHSLV